MKTNTIVLLFLLVLVITTVVGMVLDHNGYWTIHNYGSIFFSVICGLLLLKQK